MKLGACWWILPLLVVAGCKDDVCVGGCEQDGPTDGGGDADADGDADGDSDGDADADGDGDVDYDAIATAFEAQRVENDVVGLAVAIVANGEVAWSQGFGDKDLGGESVLPSTLFRASALAGTATAVGVLTLVDAGLVELDEKVSLYVPDFTVDDSPQDVDLMTVRQLLTHTSGLEPGLDAPADWPDHRQSVLDSYLTSNEFAMQYRILAPPGRLHQASVLGLALAGLVIERASGELFAEYMRAHVFDPLGMYRTTFLPIEVEDDGDFAYGFLGGRNAPTDVDNPWLRPAEGAYSSVTELALFAQFLLHGNESVLSEPLRAELIGAQFDTEQLGRVGAGEGTLSADGYLDDFWTFYPFDVRTVWTWAWLPGVGEGVSRGGYGSRMVLAPSRDFAVVMLMSRFEVALSLSPLMALRTVLDLPDIQPQLGGDPADPETYVGVFVDDFGGEVRVELQDGVLHLSEPSCDLEPVAPRNFVCAGNNDLITFLLDGAGDVEWLRGAHVVAHRVDQGAPQ